MLATNLAKKISNAVGYITDYMQKNSNSNSMYVTETNPSEILNISHSLNNTNSTCNDGLSSVIIKFTIIEIADPLTLIFNKSFNTGQFSDLLKIAKIVPIHKSN